MITTAVILMTIGLSALFILAYYWLTWEPPFEPAPVPQAPARPGIPVWDEFHNWMRDTLDMPALAS